jgi:hypothetical protein
VREEQRPLTGIVVTLVLGVNTRRPAMLRPSPLRMPQWKYSLEILKY